MSTETAVNPSDSPVNPEGKPAEETKTKRPRIPYSKERLHGCFMFENMTNAGDLFVQLIAQIVGEVNDNWKTQQRGLPKGELSASALGDERFDGFLTMLVVGGYINDLHGPNGGLVPRDVTSLDGCTVVHVSPEQIARVKARATMYLGISPRGFTVDALALSLAEKYENEGWTLSIVNACIGHLPDLIVKGSKVRRATADERKEKVASIAALYPLGMPGVSSKAE